MLLPNVSLHDDARQSATRRGHTQSHEPFRIDVEQVSALFFVLTLKPEDSSLGE